MDNHLSDKVSFEATLEHTVRDGSATESHATRSHWHMKGSVLKLLMSTADHYRDAARSPTIDIEESTLDGGRIHWYHDGKTGLTNSLLVGCLETW